MPPPSRLTWLWHRWLGLSLLLPLLWWVGTAIVFVVRPIAEVRGRTWSTGQKPEPVALAGAPVPDAAAGSGVRSVTFRVVEGHQVVVVDRGPDADAALLEQGPGAGPARSLGAAIPVEWALAAARRDFAGPFEPEAVYLHPRRGPGRRIEGTGPEEVDRPQEYGGPWPAYAVHLRGSPGMHVYVDALDGEVRAT